MRLLTRVISASLVLLVLAGCRQTAMHLRVPLGFHGQIVVTCASNGDGVAAVAVDAQGHGQASVCPRDGAKVYIDRDGASTLSENVEWLRTGDGLATQLRLTVQ